MDSIEKFVKGTQLVLPGVVVATVFFVFANTVFDQFFFIVFSVVAMGAISLVGAGLISLAGAIWRGATFRLMKRRRITRASYERRNRRFASLTAPGKKIRFAVDLIAAIFAGLFLLKAYESDWIFKAANAVVFTDRNTGKSVLKFVLDEVKEDPTSSSFDKRPADKRPACRKIGSSCSFNQYIRVILDKDLAQYEGYYVYYSSRGETSGLYLSPACVIRKTAGGQDQKPELLTGPGVYISPEVIKVIEFLDLAKSPCADLVYMKASDGSPEAKPRPQP